MPTTRRKNANGTAAAPSASEEGPVPQAPSSSSSSSSSNSNSNTPAVNGKADDSFKHGYLHPDLTDPSIVTAQKKERSLVKHSPGIVISEQGRETDKKLDEHYEYEFGGPRGVIIMMTLFPMLMYYFWICLWFYDGKLVIPSGITDILPFLHRMATHVYQDAFPTPRALTGFGGLMVFQFLLGVYMPGFYQEGLPVPSLGYKTLMYKCNAMSSWYATLVVCATLHLTGIYRLTTIIEHFGEYMTASMIAGWAVSFATYYSAVLTKTTHRMSGNAAYDFFMGAALNPRIGEVDLKMWAEVRIPWVLLFLISVSGACKQYEVYGYVTPNMAFMVLATGLYINACAKGEECIPQTWDMFHEKWGWMVIFWNFSGVPFTYCYSIVYMAAHPPHVYRFSTPFVIFQFVALLTAHWIFDSSMAQKSRFRMQLQGSYKVRWTFPQWPWSTLKNPRYLQTSHGNALLIDGWWQFLRKPNYTADLYQSFSWGLCAGFGSIIPYYYFAFFLFVLTHRCGRDDERCARKYGEDWEKYKKIVPYRFIPLVY